MRIVWAASEALPYAKTGGLADVSQSLPLALSERGHKVSVIMPYYPQLMGRLNLTFDNERSLIPVPFGDSTEWIKINELRLSKNLSYYFVEFNRFYDRPSLYDWDNIEYSDNGGRFIFLSRAVMQTVKALELNPDILHTNDWHTALCCVYLNSPLYWNEPAFKNCRSILTIHNIGYQGVFHKSNLFWTGLGWEYFNVHCLEFYDQLNLLKSGIMTAHRVSTVSPTYAGEILSPAFGFNLEAPLRNCAARGRLRGILNGIDYKIWDPEHDKLLPANFSWHDQQGKIACKQALQKEFGLPGRPDVPVISVISRLAGQKGLDVLAASMEEMLPYDDVQFIAVGTGDRAIQAWLAALAEKHPKKMSAYIGYCSEKLTHLVEAGSDFFVMPSRYEPCGLNQMYSMRCGTLPIVRATGGLHDTVMNYNPAKLSASSGFKFWDLTRQALTGTIRWAVSTWHKYPDHIYIMRETAMKQDFSWNRAAYEYEQMYRDAHKRV